MPRYVKIALLVAAAVVAAQTARAQTKLLRFPDIFGNEVVFCYASDIWKAPATGGTAVRLTAHPGIEVFPSSRRTASGSPSPASTTVTSRST